MNDESVMSEYILKFFALLLIAAFFIHAFGWF
jgi:hypothetical protein